MSFARYLSACLLTACLLPCAGPLLRANEKLTWSASAREEYLEELASILDETKSPDVFMLTLRCLDDDGADPRQLIPVAIRNAERLGILADFAGKDGRKVERAATFAELLERIHKRMPQAPARQTVEAKPAPGKSASKCDPRTLIVSRKEGDPAPTCQEAPDEATILSKLPRLPRSLRHVCESSRDDVQIVTELVTDRFDEQRFFPLVGVARMHHCHWKCTVSYNETIEGRFPFYFRCTRPRVEVIYLDQDSLHVEEQAEKAAVRRCGAP